MSTEPPTNPEGGNYSFKTSGAACPDEIARPYFELLGYALHKFMYPNPLVRASGRGVLEAAAILCRNTETLPKPNFAIEQEAAFQPGQAMDSAEMDRLLIHRRQPLLAWGKSEFGERSWLPPF